MFFKKQERIEELELELSVTRQTLKEIIEARDTAITARDSNYKAFSDISEAYSTQCRELDQALESVTGYENQIIAYTEDLVREREINQALADENRDLARQLQLLQSLFGQLQITVKLPAKRG